MMALLVAAFLQVDDPGQLGKLKYAEFKERIPRAKGGDAAADVFHPSEEKGPFPAIVLSPGGGAATTRGYEGFGRWFASWGYVCVVVAFNNDSADERGAQYSEVLDWLVKKNAEDGWALKGRIDAAKFVAGGHSRGGWASVVAARKDKRFVACVAMAPSGPEKAAGDNRPAICLISGDDGDEKTCAALYAQFEKPRAQVTVEGMDHFFAPQGKAQIVIKYATAFLNVHVKKDERYKEFLKGGDGVTVVTD